MRFFLVFLFFLCSFAYSASVNYTSQEKRCSDCQLFLTLKSPYPDKVYRVNYTTTYRDGRTSSWYFNMSDGKTNNATFSNDVVGWSATCNNDDVTLTLDTSKANCQFMTCQHHNVEYCTVHNNTHFYIEVNCGKTVHKNCFTTYEQANAWSSSFVTICPDCNEMKCSICGHTCKQCPDRDDCKKMTCDVCKTERSVYNVA